MCTDLGDDEDLAPKNKPAEDDGVYHDEDDGVYHDEDDGVYHDEDDGVYHDEDDGVYHDEDDGVYHDEDDGVYRATVASPTRPTPAAHPAAKPTSDDGIFDDDEELGILDDPPPRQERQQSRQHSTASSEGIGIISDESSMGALYEHDPVRHPVSPCSSPANSAMSPAGSSPANSSHLYSNNYNRGSSLSIDRPARSALSGSKHHHDDSTDDDSAHGLHDDDGLSSLDTKTSQEIARSVKVYTDKKRQEVESLEKARRQFLGPLGTRLTDVAQRDDVHSLSEHLGLVVTFIKQLCDILLKCVEGGIERHSIRRMSELVSALIKEEQYLHVYCSYIHHLARLRVLLRTSGLQADPAHMASLMAPKAGLPGYIHLLHEILISKDFYGRPALEAHLAEVESSENLLRSTKNSDDDLARVDKEVSGLPRAMDDGTRHLFRKGRVMKTGERLDKKRPKMIYLFSDFILFADIKKDKLVFKDLFALANNNMYVGTKFNNTSVPPQLANVGFLIRCNDVDMKGKGAKGIMTYLLFCEGANAEHQRDVWIREISAAVEHAQDHEMF